MIKMTLERTEYAEWGIFGELKDQDGKIIAFTIEHSYNGKPKLPHGEYKCVRGMHKIGASLKEIETFEIKEVPGHWGVLFHTGNKHEDSAGCVLLGLKRTGSLIVDSGRAFTIFMRRLDGYDSFELEVRDK